MGHDWSFGPCHHFFEDTLFIPLLSSFEGSSILGDDFSTHRNWQNRLEELLSDARDFGLK